MRTLGRVQRAHLRLSREEGLTISQLTWQLWDVMENLHTKWTFKGNNIYKLMDRRIGFNPKSRIKNPASDSSDGKSSRTTNGINFFQQIRQLMHSSKSPRVGCPDPWYSRGPKRPRPEEWWISSCFFKALRSGKSPCFKNGKSIGELWWIMYIINFYGQSSCLSSISVGHGFRGKLLKNQRL